MEQSLQEFLQYNFVYELEVFELCNFRGICEVQAKVAVS